MTTTRRLLLLVLLVASAPALAGGTNFANFFQSVPTLDEVGLGALIALVAAAAGWALRRRARR